MSGDKNIFIQRTSVTAVNASGNVIVGRDLTIFQDGTHSNPQRQQLEVADSLISIAKQCYREEMDKLTSTVLPVDAAILLTHHKGAVAAATRRVSGTMQVQKHIIGQINSVLQDMFRHIELINVKKQTAGKAIGIDFGTSLCCVAVCKKPQKPKIIPNDNDNSKTPSYVAFLDILSNENDPEVVCGETAKQQASSNPKGTIFDVKRMLGQRVSSSFIQQCINFWPFDVVSENDQILVRPGRTTKQTFTPVQMTAYLLRHLVKLAEDFLESPVVNAVIAVPVEFSAYQEMLIRDACESAHLSILQLVHEPTAASIAYNNVRDKNTPVESTHCVIIDFGGGTFDVAVLQIHKHRVHILGTGGDNCLGGNSIDANMAEYCIAKFKEHRGVDLKKQQNAQDLVTAEAVSKYLRQLIVNCEDHKKVLSQKTKTIIYMDEILGAQSLSIYMTKEEFYSINADIFEKGIQIIRKVLTDCDLDKLAVDEVVLVGGSSRIPVFRKMIKDFFQKEPLLKSVKVDEAVAAGAAILASEAFDLSVPSVLVPKLVICSIECSADAFKRVDLKPKTISHPPDLSEELDMPELHSEPGSSRTVCTTESGDTLLNENNSKSLQNSEVKIGVHAGGELFVGSQVITVWNANDQNKAPPVTTFVQIDSPTPSFTGRQDLLKQIHLQMQECFTHKNYADRIVVLCGLGGIGKSALARMYAQSNINDPIIQNIAWIDAETKTSLKSSFDLLAKKLKLPQSTNILETVNLVYTHFSKYVKTGLFIFDNAPLFNDNRFEILKFLPVLLKHKPLMLITSQERDWIIPKKNIIQVENLNEDESFELILKLLQPSFNCHSDAHRSTVNKLVQASHGFPLEISLAANNIKYEDEIDFNYQVENYIKRMNVPLGSWADDEQPGSVTRYQLIMRDVWDTTLEKIETEEKEGGAAINLLKLMAYLPTDGITVQLMSHLYNFIYNKSITQKSFSILIEKSMVSIARISEALLTVSEFNRNTRTKITIHKFVQHMTREKLDQNKEYFYLSRICDYFANMKLQGHEYYSDDAVVCLHEHLKARKWPRNFICYSVIFCSFLSFFESQNLEHLYTIAKDVYVFLEIKKLKIEELQTDKSAVNLFALCCLWINNSFEESVQRNFVELSLDSKFSKQKFELSFQSLKAPSPNDELRSKMDLLTLQKHSYTFCHQHIHHFLASKINL